MKINFKLNSLILLSTIILFAYGCTKPKYGYADTSKKNNEAVKSETLSQIQAVLSGSAPVIQRHIFPAVSGKVIVGQKGTRITIAPNSFVHQNGQAVSGDVDFELQEIFDVGEMIGSGLTTTSEDKLLVSGGELYLNATQKGNPLKLASGSSLGIQVPSNNPDPQMKLFVGSGSPDSSNFDWQAINNPVQSCNDSITQFFGYCFDISQLFNYINCDYFQNDPRPLTDVEIKVPATYNDTNTVVFIHVPSINSIAKIYHYQNGSFWVDGGYKLPVGLSVNFVAVHKDVNGNMFYAYQSNTIANSHVETLSFQQVTVAQLQAFISSL